jgi:peroxiredoxin
MELHEFYKDKFGLDIESYNGKGRLGLPVPGTFVINTDGKIIAAHAELDYKQRMEPKAILQALKSIKG